MGRRVWRFMANVLLLALASQFARGSETDALTQVQPGVRQLFLDDALVERREGFQRMVNPNVSVQYKPLPEDDPKRRQPDITKAKQLLDWEPSVELEAGLERTIADFRARMAANGTLSDALPNIVTATF